MATNQSKTVNLAETGHQRGVMFEDIDHDRVANAIRYLSFAKLYYPDKYHEFLKLIALRHATWSMEDGNFINALYDIEENFSEFLEGNKDVEREVNRLSPKQMVDRVDIEEFNNAKDRREAARKIAKRAVATAAKQGRVIPNEAEIEGVVRSAAIEAGTPAAFQQRIQERAPEAASEITEAIKEDPAAIQKLLFGDLESTRAIVDRVVFFPLPNKRALDATIANLLMEPNETRDVFLARAEAIAKTAMVLSSDDLSQTPVARAEPSGFVSAILEAGGNKSARIAFERLTEQAKNAVSLVVVAEAWEKTIDAITKRAGGALVETFEPMIREAKRQSGVYSENRSFKQAKSLVGDILNPILGRTFADLAQLDSINRTLPTGKKILPEGAVTRFIESLSAARGAEGAPSAVLFLAVTTQYPGVQFTQQHADNPLAPVVTVIQFAKDSVAWKIVDRAAKSEVVKGFFGRILRPVLGFLGIKVGGAAAGAVGAAAGKAAGAAAGKGLSALIGSLLGGIVAPVVGHILGFVGGFLVMPLFNKVKGWVGNLLTGRIGQLGVVQDAIVGAFGARVGGRSAQEEQKRTDFMIALVVGVPIIILITATMFQITTKDSALVESFEASRLSGRGFGEEGLHAITYTGPTPPASLVGGCPIAAPGRITQCPNTTSSDDSHFGGRAWSNAYDIGLPTGSEVFSTHGGYLVEYVSGIPVGGGKGYGNYVVLAGSDESGKIYYTVYAHLRDVGGDIKQICGGASRCFNPGSTILVSPQAPLGTSDDTGNSTGPHLHYELRYADGGKPGLLLPDGCGGYAAGMCQ